MDSNIVFLFIIVVIALIPIMGVQKAGRFPSMLIKGLFDLVLLGGSFIVSYALLQFAFADEYINSFDNGDVGTMLVTSFAAVTLWVMLRLSILNNQGKGEQK